MGGDCRSGWRPRGTAWIVYRPSTVLRFLSLLGVEARCRPKRRRGKKGGEGDEEPHVPSNEAFAVRLVRSHAQGFCGGADGEGKKREREGRRSLPFRDEQARVVERPSELMWNLAVNPPR